jgi:hypothetical protein
MAKKQSDMSSIVTEIFNGIFFGMFKNVVDGFVDMLHDNVKELSRKIAYTGLYASLFFLSAIVFTAAIVLLISHYLNIHAGWPLLLLSVLFLLIATLVKLSVDR